MVPVSGNGLRPSFFGGTADKARSFHPTLGRNTWMGDAPTPADWYLRATKAIAAFDDLLSRTAKISEQATREGILNWVGRANISETPAYKYAALKADLDLNVNNFTPPNTNAFLVAGRQKLVEILEAANQIFEGQVLSAENAFGSLAQPVVIDRDKILSRSDASKWILPVIVGVAAVGVAAVVTILGKK